MQCRYAVVQKMERFLKAIVEGTHLFAYPEVGQNKYRHHPKNGYWNQAYIPI